MGGGHRQVLRRLGGGLGEHARRLNVDHPRSDHRSLCSVWTRQAVRPRTRAQSIADAKRLARTMREGCASCGEGDKI